MILDLPGKSKLTYCLNVHPGEAWAGQLAALRDKTLALKERLGYVGKFGAGLRISARGADDLQDPVKREEAKSFFRENGLDPFTFNGFPYGTFHGTRVKEKVYQPDWKTRERVDYTKTLAEIMAGWLPGGKGSISTVPGTFGVPSASAEDEAQMGIHLAECALFLHELEEQSGCEIILGLEPEPACYLETTAQLIRFFEKIILIQGRSYLVGQKGFSNAESEGILRRHLGICFDTCHAAIQFETIEDSLRNLDKAGIAIAKIQISNALEISNSNEARRALGSFVESVYLHQVRAKLENGEKRSWTDLPEALEELSSLPDGITARIHFHVPLFWEGDGHLRSTQEALTPRFWDFCRQGITPHLEMETYTFSVLPEAAGRYEMTDMLEREYRWVLAQLGS